MKFAYYLNEEWVESIKISYSYGSVLYDIYKNPTSSDYTDLRKRNHNSSGIRFVVDLDNKDIYIWNDDLLHHTIITHLKLNKKNILVGSGYMDRVRIRATTIGSYIGNNLSFQSKVRRKWLDRYFMNLDNWKLDEEYVGQINVPVKKFGINYEIFKNPTKKELRDTSKEVRYIADFKYKNLFVWNSDFIHIYGAGALMDAGEMDNVYTNSEYVKLLSTGVAVVVGGKLEIIESDYGIAPDAKWINMDDKWLNPWFTKYNKTMIKLFGNRE